MMMALPLGQFLFNLVGFLVVSGSDWLLEVEEVIDLAGFEEETGYTQMLMYVFLGLASFIGGGSLYFNG